jgi:hypothetical protein
VWKRGITVLQGGTGARFSSPHQPWVVPTESFLVVVAEPNRVQ